MRKFLILFFIILFIQNVFSDPFFSKDKIDHLFTTFAITASTSLFVKSLVKDKDETLNLTFSVSIPVLFSFGKEVYDNFTDGTVSYKDLIYDFMGIGLGYAIVRLR
ncbi:MAG: hypothetical protein QME48_01015 [bacterium]|uniref:VanZ-like domain-containing protein n=2 Tax=Bacteria candidate phyla TaxID=1783234 RepID=A0A124G0J2_UNCT6|nr:MAG: hypothetical protein XD76_0297 [candidate division TA06 bacterium 32_111]KUK87670.1 MAG: hypothetical protein XE03_0561 [candidate division TA06 bacterium 34_109]MDI6699804.1 hypothetical protein [bacterium]HAF07509.1 hypothetical protein [candidate division WOR-3 bacterium]HCP17578.1 hypothetical protein [candidate division WOR-3 bacterium]